MIIDHKEWSEDHFFYPGPCVDRGEISERLLQDFVPGISLQRGGGPLFYKDQKFRPFGGRARSYQLKEGEVYFQQFPNFFNPMAFLDGQVAQKVAHAREAFHNIEILQIDFKDTTDSDNLSRPIHFKLALSDRRELECEYLFYGRSPREFLDMVKDKERLGNEFIRYSSQFEKNFSLVAIFNFDSPLVESSQTFFIPQSQTYDEGHFIVEVEDCAESFQQVFRVHCQMLVDQVAEEDVSRKLSLLKRTLRRLFTGFTCGLREEKIYLLDYFPFCPISEEAQEGSIHFSYFGWNAPLNRKFLQDCEIVIDPQVVFNNARSLLSLKQIQSRFL